MYNREWISQCCGYNWVFSRLTGHGASYSLVSFLLRWNRSQWIPLTSGFSHSFSVSPKVSSLNVTSKEGHSKSFSSVPFYFFFSPFYMKESLEVTPLFLGNSGFPIIITFCMFDGFFLWAAVTFVTASIWLLTLNWLMMLACIVVLPDSRFEVAIHSTSDTWCGAWPFRALAITERDHYLSSRLQLCGFREAMRVVLPALVLTSPCRHITLSLMRSWTMTWLAR